VDPDDANRKARGRSEPRPYKVTKNENASQGQHAFHDSCGVAADADVVDWLAVLVARTKSSLGRWASMRWRIVGKAEIRKWKLEIGRMGRSQSPHPLKSEGGAPGSRGWKHS
jgi:hypothetical protein